MYQLHVFRAFTDAPINVNNVQKAHGNSRKTDRIFCLLRHRLFSWYCLGASTYFSEFVCPSRWDCADVPVFIQLLGLLNHNFHCIIADNNVQLSFWRRSCKTYPWGIIVQLGITAHLPSCYLFKLLKTFTSVFLYNKNTINQCFSASQIRK